MDLILRIKLGRHNGIFDVPHPLLWLHVNGKTTRNFFPNARSQERHTKWLYEPISLGTASDGSEVHGLYRR
jgi:hypothetical protein